MCDAVGVQVFSCIVTDGSQNSKPFSHRLVLNSDTLVMITHESVRNPSYITNVLHGYSLIHFLGIHHEVPWTMTMQDLMAFSWC